MQRYSKEGFPKNYGLIETNFMIFNMRHPIIHDLLTAWRNELANETHRDQLSINYILWKFNVEWMPLMHEGQSLRDNKDFAYFAHGKNTGYLRPLVQGSKQIAPSNERMKKRDTVWKKVKGFLN